MITKSGATVRRATPADAARIADAHRDSIQTIGAAYYPPNVVVAWQERVAPELYIAAMEGGEAFFIAERKGDAAAEVLGFASDYTIKSREHGVSAYVRSCAARLGIGSALLELAEADAKRQGAAVIRIDASLAAVEFYKANGYTEIGRGHTDLASGQPIECVFMKKELTNT